MKPGQHEPLGGGEAVVRYNLLSFLHRNHSLGYMPAQKSPFISRVSHFSSEARWRVLTALSLMLSVTILQLKATSHPRFPRGILFK